MEQEAAELAVLSRIESGARVSKTLWMAAVSGRWVWVAVPWLDESVTVRQGRAWEMLARIGWKCSVTFDGHNVRVGPA